jgi:hypothetical protein
MVAYVQRVNAAEAHMREQQHEIIKMMCARILVEKDAAAFAQLLVELNRLLENTRGRDSSWSDWKENSTRDRC